MMDDPVYDTSLSCLSLGPSVPIPSRSTFAMGRGVGGLTILIIMPLCGPILQVENSSKIFNYKCKSSDRAKFGMF